MAVLAVGDMTPLPPAVQTAMETDYNPVEVVEQLLAHHA